MVYWAMHLMRIQKLQEKVVGPKPQIANKNRECAAQFGTKIFHGYFDNFLINCFLEKKVKLVSSLTLSYIKKT